MRRHGNLFEQVVSWGNLYLAAGLAGRGKTSRATVARFFFHLETELLDLQAELQVGAWRPSSYHTFHIRDPKPRRISAADFRDRVVHHALMRVLDPLFERRQFGHSYACRRGKGTHAAVSYAQRLARRFPYFLKGDVDRYFETVDRRLLAALLRRMLKDPRLLEILDRIIAAPVAGAAPGLGLPIGNLTSQYFANHFLGQLDDFIQRQLRVPGYLRFMDDVLIFGSSKPELHRWRAEIRAFLADVLRLRLKEKVTWIAPVRDGIPFLGFRVFPGMIRLQGRRWQRVRRKIRGREQAYREGRLSAAALARSVQSSAAHVGHAASRRLRRRFFEQSVDLG